MKHSLSNESRSAFFRRIGHRAAIAFSAVFCVILIAWFIDQSWLYASSYTLSSPLSSGQEESLDASRSALDTDESAQEISASETDGSSQTISEAPVQDLPWYLPGGRGVPELSQTEWRGPSTDGSAPDYVFINEEQAALLQTGEHGNCKYFRYNNTTGRLECLDHIVRNILAPAGILQPGDEIFMDYSSDCTDRYLLFYVNHYDVNYRGSFQIDMAEGTFLRFPIDLRKEENWQISNDYSWMVVGKYTDRWRYYRVDIATNETSEILETEGNTIYSFGLTAANRYFWYATYHGQKKDTWCYYDLESGARRTFQTEYVFCVTPDDRYVVYYNSTGLRRMDLSTGEDILLAERGADPYWENKRVEAYNPDSGRVLLSWMCLCSGQVLYIYDTVVGKGEKLAGFDEKQDQLRGAQIVKGGPCPLYADETESLRNLSGTKAWLTDHNSKYVLFYADASFHAKYIYSYSMTTGELYKVALPESFLDKIQRQANEQSAGGNRVIVIPRIDLSDDAERLCFSLEVSAY